MVYAWKRVPGHMCTISFRVHVCWSEHPDLSFTYQFVNLICGLGTLTTQFIVHFVFSQTSVFLLFWNDVHFYCVIYSVCVCVCFSMLQTYCLSKSAYLVYLRSI